MHSLLNAVFCPTNADHPLKNEYLKGLAVLPSIHKDPFDRLLIATALEENLILITADESIQKYDVPWIW